MKKKETKKIEKVMRIVCPSCKDIQIKIYPGNGFKIDVKAIISNAPLCQKCKPKP